MKPIYVASHQRNLKVYTHYVQKNKEWILDQNNYLPIAQILHPLERNYKKKLKIKKKKVQFLLQTNIKRWTTCTPHIMHVIMHKNVYIIGIYLTYPQNYAWTLPRNVLACYANIRSFRPWIQLHAQKLYVHGHAFVHVSTCGKLSTKQYWYTSSLNLPCCRTLFETNKSTGSPYM